MALTYPGPRTGLVVARDTCHPTFGDAELQQWILNKEPKGLDNALCHATRIEAYSYRPDGSEKHNLFGKKDKRRRVVSADDKTLAETNEKLKELQRRLDINANMSKSSSVGAHPLPPETSGVASQTLRNQTDGLNMEDRRVIVPVVTEDEADVGMTSVGNAVKKDIGLSIACQRLL